MQHFTIYSNSKKFFVTFHGTGGNEHSLLRVTGEVDPTASVISFLGETGTGRGRRYFDPLVQGKLERDNFEEKVAEFLEIWKQAKPADAEITFIGYSNGANFILGILEKMPNIADRVILMHPSNLGYQFSSGSDTPILLTTGASDTLSVPGEIMKLTSELKEYFPHTESLLLDSGHEISDTEIEAIAKFMR